MNNKFSDIYSLMCPSSFKEIFGQELLIALLSKTINLDLIPFFLVFYGEYGIGKTSIARIYAKSCNCLKLIENMYNCNSCSNCVNSNSYTYEINSSNYTQADSIRDIIDESKYVGFYGKYKFYILDEFHSLSHKSFSMLLKETEQPSSHVRYIGITNKISAIPKNLLSRALIIKFNNFNPNHVQSIINHVDNTARFLINNEINSSSHQDAINYLKMKSVSSYRETINYYLEYLLNSDSISQSMNSYEISLQSIFNSYMPLSEKVEIIKGNVNDLESFCSYVIEECCSMIISKNNSEKSIIVGDLLIEYMKTGIFKMGLFLFYLSKIDSELKNKDL